MPQKIPSEIMLGSYIRVSSDAQLGVKFIDLFMLFLGYKLRCILQGESKLWSAQLQSWIIISLPANTKEIVPVQ